MVTRIVSAAVAIVIAAVVLFLHDTIVFYFAVSLLTLLMLYEIFHAAGCLKYRLTTVVCFLFGAFMPFFYYEKIESFRYFFLTACLAIIFITYILQHKALTFEKLCIMITSSVLITLSMNAMISIKESNEKHGLFLLVLSLCGAWLADSGAFFKGTFFGKHKLCPEISPKKTIEGVIGGTITNALLFILIGFVYTKFQSANDISVSFNYFYLALFGMACSLLGLLGDLSASLVKRQFQIKDYGNIMPGHGGAMDRFDSVLFVIPFMYLFSGYLFK
ncbi:MAG: phosphatidate cytidylyltransferase [Oscillospiraceae bacterium]|jgi:phosphatidate cytidylyltransferase